MTLRHVILEGPDGSGKTYLKEQILRDRPQFRPHVRAADSLAGPDLGTLSEWVINDTSSIATQRPSVYDRHPLVSEPIYGPICRNSVPGMFNKDWWVRSMSFRVAQSALLVVCMPPLVDVATSLRHGGQHMDGVVENIDKIYAEYQRVWSTWPGVLVRHDYTRTNAGLMTLANIDKVIN